MTETLVGNEVGPRCPECGVLAEPGDRFCEDCGADLLVASAGTPDATSGPAHPEAACVACGATEIDADGFCTTCGFAQPAARDRVELDLGVVAAVSDRGHRHTRNEDAMALRVVGSAGAETVGTAGIVVVVCDGVSTADRPDEAAKAAADAAADLLSAALRANADIEAATRDAVAMASKAVVDLADPAADNAPACTFVSAVLTSAAVTVGWIGDSRAYWLSEADAYPLTTDDSWAERMISSGRLTEAEAFADRRAHALVGWLGADAGDLPAHVRTLHPTGHGVVLVCTDGLWNYLRAADELARAALPSTAVSPLTAAAVLTKVALDGGGHDNITVAVAPFPPETSRSARS
jgi:serine/threonine protein phosphatase PrpC